MSDNVNYHFKRFKIVVILFYATFSLFYIISPLEGNTKEFLMDGIMICYVVMVCLIWYHIWNGAIIVGKNPFLYSFLAACFTFLGPLVGYIVLKKASLALSSDIRKKIDVG